MIAETTENGVVSRYNLALPFDISIPLREGAENVSAWYVAPMTIEPVATENFTGSVKAGGSVNFRNIFFNPHGNGTHTECVGHIADEVYSVNQCLIKFFFSAQLISISPKPYDGTEGTYKKSSDWVITQKTLAEQFAGKTDAIIIRTLPNDNNKINHQYSNTNWPYITVDAMIWLVKQGVKHLLIDLPSVDREYDGGNMEAHRAFWRYPSATRFDCTITEMIYVDNNIPDGFYLLNLQIASFENDASPSKPVIYPKI